MQRNPQLNANGELQRIAVLGYLAELGEHEQDGHVEVGRLAAELGVDRVVVVGEAARGIHGGASAVSHWGGESVLVTDQAAALGWLREQLRAGDVVLVKGSRYRTWDVVDGLRHSGRDSGDSGTDRDSDSEVVTR